MKWLREARRVAILAIAAAVLGAAMVRLAPGFGVDERELDAHASGARVESVRQSRAAGTDFAVYCWESLRKLAVGDLGYSTTLNRPNAELLRDRLPVTLRELGFGVGMAGLIAVGLALLARTVPALETAVSALSGFWLCLPAAVLGFLTLWFRMDAMWPIALTVVPHMHRYTSNALQSIVDAPFSVAAQSRGVGRWRVLLVHGLLPCAPELLAAAGVSMSIAFGASIPIESVADVPGVGQLAWQAASSRDLPLLFVITLAAAILILSVNGAAECLRSGVSGEPAA